MHILLIPAPSEGIKRGRIDQLQVMFFKEMGNLGIRKLCFGL